VTPSVTRPLAAIVAAVVAIVTAIKILLRLPAVPYNVATLFLDDGSVIALSFFALTILWIGAGAMVTALALARSRRPYLVLPIAIIVVSLVSKMLVSRGVTYESLDDVLGSNNLFGLVTSQNVWGQWWRDAFFRVGPDAVDFLERRVRYCALYSIPLVAIVLGLLPSAIRRGPQGRIGRGSWVATVAVAILWIWTSGAIVLAWAATDNLTELIAEHGPLGIPGPLFLVGVVAVVASNMGLLLSCDRSVVRWLLAIAASAGGLVLSWYLLNAGLEQHLSKYSFVFSGTQFLLGPDRQHQLTTIALFSRWSVVYVGAVSAMALGAWIADSVAAAVGATSRGSTAPEVS
jgi:hypothetical protein